MLWQHIATAAVATSLGTMLDGAVETYVGAAMVALGCVGVGVLTCAILSMIVFILGVQLLDRLTSDD